QLGKYNLSFSELSFSDLSFSDLSFSDFFCELTYLFGSARPKYLKPFAGSLRFLPTSNIQIYRTP
ncbi:MAG: hypothetical protein LBS44_06935, partial [Deltaproteobacteria bacterium]|nr:hypothetical protein [Deltaproteobacteria bacterium]